MALEYGISSKGRPTVLYQNFEYVKDKKRMWNNSAELSISSNNVKHDSLHPATGWSVAGIQVTTTLAMSALLVHERRSGK